jgi:hypothetical protein
VIAKSSLENSAGARRGYIRLEGLILTALKNQLMSPQLVKERRKLNKLVDAIAEGFRAPELRQRLDEMSQRKAAMEAAIKTRPVPFPRFHPNLPELYRQKVEQLHEALKCMDGHEEALAILRGLIS